MRRIELSRRSLLRAGGAFGALSAGLLPTFALAQAKPIKVGFVVPLTGPYGVDAQAEVKGAELAVRQFNDEGGLNGRRAELVVRDDKLNPGEAASKALELVEKDRVDFLAGPFGAAVFAVNSIAKQRGVVYNSVGNSDTINEVKDRSEFTFHEGLTCHVTGGALARYLIPKGLKRVAVLMADYVYGQETSRGFVRAARQLSAEIVTEVRHPIGMSDYSPFFSKIQAAKPDLLLVSNFGRDQQISLRQITEFSLKRQMKVAVPILVHTARLVEGHETYDGVIGCMSYYWKLEDTIPSAKAFNAAYRSLHGGIAPTDYSALGYSCVRTLLAASRDAGNTDAASVIKALEKLEYDFMKGNQYFRRCDHQSVQSVVVLTSKAPAPGVAKDDIFKILAVEAEGEKTLRTCEELGYTAN